MNEKLECIKKVIGEEGYTRVLEVLKILDVEMPESFDIYRSGDYYDHRPLLNRVNPENLDSETKYAILFSNNIESVSNIKGEDMDKIGFLDFNKNYQTISFIRDGYFYSWERFNPINEMIRISKERRDNYKNSISVSLEDSDEVLCSSRLKISSKSFFPTIYSNMDEVEVREETYDGWGSKDVFEIKEPISQYNSVFRKLLTEPSYQYIVSEGLNNKKVYNLLLKVMKGPIDRIIYNMTLTDQSWRFEKEIETIEAFYQSDLKDALKQYEEALEEAKRRKEDYINYAQSKRDNRLDEISALEAKYKSQFKLTK